MRDDFAEQVKRTLAARVGNLCSNPDCQALTSGPQDDPTKVLNVGVAAHISAASVGGPRYNPSLTPEQRCHLNNGIWLCQNCAKLIDDDLLQFTEELLRAWKTVAEYRARNAIGKTSSPSPESESQRKRRAILEWKDKTVTLSVMNTGNAVRVSGPRMGSSTVNVLDCTEYVVKVGSAPGTSNGFCKSIPLDNITIGHDDQNNRLELQERYS